MTYWSTTLAQENIKPADTAVAPSPALTESGTTEVPVGADGQPLPAAGPQDPLGGNFMIMLLVLMGVMVLMTFRSQSKEKKKRKELLATLSKGDKVQTIGGIIGNIVEIREDGEVIVKVDENSNTKMKFARSAIQNKIES
ncbi:MAG: preprotein translocase subunit YajC [Gammaproteobacteria bacterium]|nr:preprotein translocase subunit YajC [Gammaproteobacteria bacterium]